MQPRHLEVLSNSISGVGIEGSFQLGYRIICFLMLPLMLVLVGVFGRNTGKISDKFHINVTPPGPFFAIWGLIYTCLIVAAIYSMAENVWSIQTIILFAIGNLLNGVWVYIFDHGTIRAINLSTIIVITMAILNEFVWIQMNLPSNIQSSVGVWAYVNRNIIAFYEGWLIAASNLNFGVTLVHYFNISKKTQTYIFWICTPIIVAGVGLYNCLSNNGGALYTIGLFISAAYALTGAMISTRKNNTQQGANQYLVTPNRESKKQ